MTLSVAPERRPAVQQSINNLLAAGRALSSKPASQARGVRLDGHSFVTSKQQVYSSSQGCHTATGTHMPHGITQCYLPPDRGDIPS